MSKEKKTYLKEQEEENNYIDANKDAVIGEILKTIDNKDSKPMLNEGNWKQGESVKLLKGYRCLKELNADMLSLGIDSRLYAVLNVFNMYYPIMKAESIQIHLKEEEYIKLNYEDWDNEDYEDYEDFLI